VEQRLVDDQQASATGLKLGLKRILSIQKWLVSVTSNVDKLSRPCVDKLSRPCHYR
jgi:hypothetical protein